MDPPTRRELPVVERTAARLVVLDAAGRVLLLHVQDLSNPQFGTVWELPGGGIEPGETYSQAALRELREETGIEVAPERIEEIEETLIRADLGVDVAARIATVMGAGRYQNVEEVQQVLAAEIEKVMVNGTKLLSEINTRLSAHGINILGQFLKTNEEIGYVILDVDSKISSEAFEILKGIKGTIKARIVY